MIHLPQRRLRIEPLRVLLVAVEDERRADESVVDQLLHVLHRRAVAKGEAELRLHALFASPAPRRAACRDSRTRRASRTARASPPRAPPTPARSASRSACRRRRGRCRRARSALRARRRRSECRISRRTPARARDRIGDRDELATSVAFVSRQVCELRPRTGAEHSDS